MDVRFTLFGFPVRFQVWFLLTAWLIRPRAGAEAPHLQLVWMVVVALGVLAHELGHAAAARRAGFFPVIDLHGFGGTTMWQPTRPLGRAGEAAITAAGPALGIAIGATCLVLSWWLPLAPGSLPATVLSWATWVTLGWGVLNLVPINPLDGGKLIVLAAGAVWPSGGPFAARLVSLALAAGLAVWAFLAGQLWMGVILLLLMISNVQELRHSRRSPLPPAGA